jgi:hypothetical protein
VLIYLSFSLSAQPTIFTLTLSRSYSWEVDKAKDQILFLQSAVRIYRRYTGDDGPVCVGFEPNISTSGSGDGFAPAPSNTLPSSSSPPKSLREARGVPSINTQVPVQITRDSPASAGSRRGLDGFYPAPSPNRTANSIPAVSPSLESANEDRRPMMQRNPSTGSGSGSRPVHREEQNGTAALPFNMTQPGIFSENYSVSSPKSLSAELPALERVGGRSPSRSDGFKNESPLNRMPSGGKKNRSETSLVSIGASSTSTIRNRIGRSDSIGAASMNGDARRRLSTTEPVRGGAAYEKMLLAGTGLTGVAEGDDEEEENAYGGAEVKDAGDETHEEILPRATRKTSLKVRKKRSMGLRDASEVGNMTGELDDDDEEDLTLLNVEEMLEGFEWRNNHSNGLVASRGAVTLRHGAKGGKGPADVIEARLLDELAALDAANIHAIIESDDRVSLVVRHMEEALHQLDVIDSMVASYKMQLNARADDIKHIEGQNRGLQVQTSNQRALSNEIDKLLSTVQVDETAVDALLHDEFETDEGISLVETAGAALYKAMLQARRTEEETRGGDASGPGLAAATERLDEYANLADEFAGRFFDYLSETFKVQTKAVLKDPTRLNNLSPPNPTIEKHTNVEELLGRYCGLLLYAKEVSPHFFQRISASYYTSTSERYKSEMIMLIAVWKGLVSPVTDEEVAESSFLLPGQSSLAARGGTVRRAGRHLRKGSKGPTEVSGYEAFQRVLVTIIPLVANEQRFIADLLHINATNITYADYMGMEVYFRRRAADVFDNSTAGAARDMKNAMDLIFGFLSPEIQSFGDQVFSKDRLQLVGVLAAMDRALIEVEELNNEFLMRTLGKLHMRLASQLDKFVHEQIRIIEQTKLTVKKRKGVTHFIIVFPSFVEKVEAQLVDCETLNIRGAIDTYYELICNSMFDVLQAMAIPKVDGGVGSHNTDEDKGLLNHHIILIENMYHFVKGVGRLRGSSALEPLLNRAQNMLDDALSSYVQSALRRPLGKMMDFGDGIDALLRSTPAAEVSLHSAYNKQAAKRLSKDYHSKDIRKSIETLSKRVIKHFDEDEVTHLAEASNIHDASGISAEEIIEVLGLVWRSLEDGYSMECERLQRILRECYSDSSSRILCDFTIEDVRRPFASNSPAARKR